MYNLRRTEGNCCDACLSAANLNEEISQADETLKRLLAKRFTVLTAQNRKHDDIVQLPLEISGYIFEMSLPERETWGTFRKQDDSGRMPSLLASVCTAWRDIALSTPRLWSTIHITLSEFDPSMSAQLVQHWVDRSRALPLSLNITLSRNVPTTSAHESSWDPIFQVVNQCSDRWKVLSLFLPGVLLRRVRGNGRNQSPLTKLRVNGRGYGFHALHPKLAFSKPLPSPKTVQLVSVRPIGLSWSRLRYASLQHLTANECIELLKKAPRLTRCSVINIRTTRFPDSSIHVVHPAMKTLRLHIRKAASRVPMLESFMNALTLPNLREFDCDSLDAISPGHVLALVRRSSCPLVKLRTGSRSMMTSAGDPEFLRHLDQFSSAN